jgi:hypothetical protein
MEKEEAVIMEAKELYPSLIQMIIQAENITWSRFNNFLMFNTILVLAWSTIYAADPSLQHSQKWPLGAFCLIGVLSGVSWAFLGYRGRAYLKKYLEIAEAFENDHHVWGNELNKEDYKLAKTTSALTVELNNCVCLKLGSSKCLLTIIPAAFSILYLFLIYVSFKC